MSLHPDVIDAARVAIDDNAIWGKEKRARRVIRAQAQHMSDAAVKAALDSWFTEDWRKGYGAAQSEKLEWMRAAIAAALNHAAGEE